MLVCVYALATCNLRKFLIVNVTEVNCHTVVLFWLNCSRHHQLMGHRPTIKPLVLYYNNNKQPM